MNSLVQVTGTLPRKSAPGRSRHLPGETNKARIDEAQTDEARI